MTAVSQTNPVSLEVGRYQLHDVVASGGMASVHLGRILGPAGFSRVLAIKRLHPHLARDPKFAAMFLDEARLASRIAHPNVVGTLDVVAQDGELFLVMEYVRGEALSQLLHAGAIRGAPPPVPVVVAIVVGALYGLHAAHQARDPSGRALNIVHRDVSPQNVLVGVDGVPRVVDFGIAKAVSRVASTMDGEIKGKLAYMAPEQLRRGDVDRRTDVYAAAVVLWEALTSRRLFVADAAGGIVLAVLEGNAPPPSTVRSEIGAALDAVVLRGLARDPRDRYESALAMADALAAAVTPAPPREVGEWVERVAHDSLAARAERVAALEAGAAVDADSVRSSAELGILSDVERQRMAGAATGPIDVLPPAPSGEPTVRDAVDVSPPPRRRTFLVALSLVAVTMVGFAASSLARRVEPPAPTVASPPTGSGSAPRSEEVVAPSADTPAPIVEPAMSASSLTAAAASSAPPAAKNAGPRRAPPRHVAPAPRPSAAEAKTPGCDPPYTLDESGIKRFKRWCKNSE